MTLISPSGRLIDRNTTDPDVVHDNGPTWEFYTVINPEAGEWIVELYGADVPDGGEEVDVTVTATPVDHLGERNELVIDILSNFLPTGSDKSDKGIEKALEHLKNSLDPKFWKSDFTLTKKGKKVFDEEKKAVRKLKKIHDPTILGIIKSIVDISNSLAQTALKEAMAAGSSQKEIDKALNETDKALEQISKGKYDKAIGHYKKAWVHARKAMK